mmetsp:Transcript_3218/g.6379  ORF Transcript_3218/g.6379 Transcript_3218/m.6379 type:complete len:95 (-) Transcript_3218:160-444(-)
MLGYMYTGELPAEHDPAELLPLADKYELPGLAEDCAAAILRNMNKDNAVSAIRAIKPYSSRPHMEALWVEMCNAFRVLLLSEDSVFRQCIDAMP